MPNVRLDFLGGSKRTRSPVSDSQATVNYYFEADEDGRGGGVLYSTPGLTEFADTTVGPCRGMSVMAGVLYVVSGTGLYSIDSAGNSTYLGAIGGTDPVGIDNNGTQLMVVTGTQGYIYTVTGGLVSITDPDFQPSYTCDVVDSYFVIAYAGTDQWAVSRINNGTAWNALDFASATSSYGNIVAVKGFRSEVWIFKEKTTEVWYNAANPVGNPFSRQDAGVMQRGCAAKYSIATDAQAIYWLGDDLRVYAATGYQPQAISNEGVEYDIAQLDDPSTARGFTYTQEGHSFYVLSFPDGKTWCFDIKTGLWHQRKSYEITRWRAEWYAYCYGMHLVGDYTTGVIGEMSLDEFAEYGDPLKSERVGKVLSSDGRQLFVNRLEVFMESGRGSLTANPKVYIEVSTDGGRTWSGPLETNSGLTGSYRTRCVWGPLGSGENFIFKFWTTDPYCRNVVGAAIDAEAGSW